MSHRPGLVPVDFELESILCFHNAQVKFLEKMFGETHITCPDVLYGIMILNYSC